MDLDNFAVTLAGRLHRKHGTERIQALRQIRTELIHATVDFDTTDLIRASKLVEWIDRTCYLENAA